MSDCALCNILINEQERVLYQDEHVFVCMNYEPVKRSHIMVLPKTHIRMIGELEGKQAEAFVQAIDHAMEAVQKHTPAEELKKFFAA
jgi:diadenosine tetraphosphate (Ap4A) HIT family hydrolase